VRAATYNDMPTTRLFINFFLSGKGNNIRSMTHMEPGGITLQVCRKKAGHVNEHFVVYFLKDKESGEYTRAVVVLLGKIVYRTGRIYDLDKYIRSNSAKFLKKGGQKWDKKKPIIQAGCTLEGMRIYLLREMVRCILPDSRTTDC
jgi:hypothetical protein